MIRPFPLALLLAVIFAIAAPVSAQPSWLELAPLELEANSWYATDPGVGGLSLTARRVVPLFYFLPNVSEDSRLDLLSVTAGVRSANRDAKLAWAVSPLRMLIVKAPWAGGLSLLSYDRTGPLKVEADWLAIRGGPALRFGGPDNMLEMRLLAKASLSTIAPTGGLFVGPGDGSTGFDGALEFSLLSRIAGKAILGANASAARLFAGENPTRTTWDAWLHVWPDAPLSFRAGAGQIRLETDNMNRASGWILKAGVIFTPGMQGF
ncbi:MAG: hypothetical protein ACI80V_001577 [Rhodothermales bacterium]|jgi:hypothetical protein